MRLLVKNRGWTAIAVLALALGLGANVAIFSVVGLMVWTPLPYPGPEQLVYVSQSNAARGFRQTGVSLHDVESWRAGSTIASIAAYDSRPMAISGQGEAQQFPAMQVSPEFFPTLGIQPARGRAFLRSEGPETESRVAVISHALWQGVFRGEGSVLGRDIRLNGRNYSIVGVMPESYTYLYQPIDVWTPLSLERKQLERDWRGLETVARLKPGVSVAQASAEVRSISERLEKEDAASGLNWRGVVQPLGYRMVGSGGQVAAGTMFGAVGFVLLIACANVASLLLVRGAQRRRELAIRASLGASRGALIRLQLAESVLLSLAGGAAGVLSAIWGVPLLKRIAPPDMTFFQTAQLDWNALVFGLALSLLTGVAFGVIPAWLQTRGSLIPALQETSRGSTGGQHFLLNSLAVGEMALALVLVVATTLMVRSLIRRTTVDAGFDRTDLTTARILLSTARYTEDSQITDFYAHALENLRRDPGVESAAVVSTIPLGGANRYVEIRVEGQTETGRDSYSGDVTVSPGYFHALRIPLLAGRDFTASDSAEAQKVAIVNETFVKRYWRGESNPMGRRLKVGQDQQAPWVTVVGVARDVRHIGPFDPPRAEVYRPQAQSAGRNMLLVARARGARHDAAGALRSAVWQVDREQPLFRVQSMEMLLFRRSAGERATAEVLGLLGSIALILAAVGVYGVVAYTAAQRVREIGIRLALGATQQQVFRMVLRGGVTLAAIGLLIGLPASYGVAPFLSQIGAGVDSRDTAAYTGVALLLAAVATGACLVPAWRAMRVDPTSILRGE